MLIKDKDILSQKTKVDENITKTQPQNIVDKEFVKKSWVDVLDYYLKGIGEHFLYFHGRATPLEFWGFMAISGILFLPLYILGSYIENKMIIFYFYLITLIPSIAVCTRRFHDINKKAIWYYLWGLVSVLSCFFIGIYSLIFIILWFVVMIKLLIRKSYNEDIIFGNYLDESSEYGDSYDKILRKFFKLSLTCFIIFVGFSYISIDLWTQQNMQRIAYEDIFDIAFKEAKERNLSKEQIKLVNNEVRILLKQLSGQKISEDELKNKINIIIQQIESPENL